MRLESLVQHNCSESYPVILRETINLDEVIRSIVNDIMNNVSIQTVSTKLHNTIILTIFDCVNAIRKKEGINKIILSGGVFQNKYLLEGTTKLLEKNKFEVYSHASVPTNDGGIALGQLAVASKRRELKCV